MTLSYLSEMMFNVLDTMWMFVGIFLVIYWAFAGRLILESENTTLLKLIFLGGLIVFPLYTPIAIYLLYYKQIIPVLRDIFSKKTQPA